MRKSLQIICLTLLLALLLALVLIYYPGIAMRKEAADPMTRAAAIAHHVDYACSHFKAPMTRDEVLRILPPMNSDSKEIAVWVLPRKGETQADVTGRPHNEIMRGRHGYYLEFDKQGKIVGTLRTFMPEQEMMDIINPPIY